MQVLVITDAWHPQVNGVVRTLEHTAAAAERLGARLDFLTPARFSTLPLPSYPEIRLALPGFGAVERAIVQSGAEFVHIATEGPLGMLARRACLKRRRPFTTSYHTRFPDYIRLRFGIPERWSYAVLRRFHNAGSATMVSTRALGDDLALRGFRHLVPWSRGVDTDLFRPGPKRAGGEPTFLYVGRVAVEKNIEAFLGLDLPGRKRVVGDGPQLGTLRQRYPDVAFDGMLHGEALARAYRDADVFVFPSLTDTFGIVLLEAMASGVPVAAFPVMGPREIVASGAGVLADNLSAAALREAAIACLSIPGERCRDEALRYGWERSTRQFLDNVARACAEPQAAPAAAAAAA